MFCLNLQMIVMLYSIKTKNLFSLLVYIILLICIGFSVKLNNNLYLIYSILTITYISNRWSSPLRLVSPLSLFFLYTTISFSIGAWAFSKDLVLNRFDLISFKYFHGVRSTTIFILISLFIVDLVEERTNLKNLFFLKSQFVFLKYKFSLQEILITCFVLSFFIGLDPDLSFFGYSGSLDYFYISVVVLMLLMNISKRSFSTRLIGYLLIFISLSFVLYGSKRELIFFIFPIIFFEARNLSRVNFKSVLITAFSGFFMLLSIIIMSLLRGYGGLVRSFDPLAVIRAIPEYISDENFLKYFFNNIEVNYTFYHTYQAFEYIHKQPSFLIFGESIIKPLFILIPRSIVQAKPQSIIHRYTEIHAPFYRDRGGSFPINLLAESFFNFHWFGLVFVLFFSVLVAKFYNYFLQKNIKHIVVINLFMYMNLLMLYRGSGLDMYLTYVLLFCLFYLISVIPYYVISRCYSFSK